MTRITASVAITLGTLALAGVVWLVRLEASTNQNERDIAALEARVLVELRYIRDRLDKVLDRRGAEATSGTAPAPAFNLRVRPQVGLAPVDTEVRLHVEPGGRGREVLLEIAGPAYYRSSLFPISGNPQAPTVQPPAWYRSLPAGTYTVSAVLSERRCDGCSSRVDVARREATVIVSEQGGR